jgi:hypothetical protein
MEPVVCAERISMGGSALNQRYDERAHLRELSFQEMQEVHGGFIRELLTFIKRLPYEDEMGEECNNGICVPYIEPGDY